MRFRRSHANRAVAVPCHPSVRPRAGRPRRAQGCGDDLSPPPPLVLIAPSIVGAGSPNRIASIASFTGASYSWSISNGTITSGLGTNQVTFTAGTAGILLNLQVSVNLNSCPYGGGFANVTVAPAGEAVQFYGVTPCRLVDTRGAIGALGGPALAASGAPDRAFTVAGNCGIPAGATSVSANATVVNPPFGGALALYRGDGAPVGAISISFNPAATRAGNAFLQLALDGSGSVNVNNSSAGPVHFVLDVNGYFE
ncbi:MAG: hypothetical protein ABI584_07920 [Acidobacteriota bacterium]